MAEHCPALHTTKLEGLARDCFRAMEGASHRARSAVARWTKKLTNTAHIGFACLTNKIF